MPGNVIMLIFQLKELIKVKKVKPCRFFFLSFSPAFFLFFVIMPKKWVSRTTLNEENKGDVLLI